MNKLDYVKNAKAYFQNHLQCCHLCPRNCAINRNESVGYCRVSDLKVYTSFLHKGEEPVITGNNGSGTIFFSGCNMQCVYCQNHEFSSNDVGQAYTVNELAYQMLQLEDEGAHNINLVTPSHMLCYVVPALERALMQGLSIPIVYNCSGYENADCIAALEGIVDIYLCDFKYFSAKTAKAYSNAPNYPDIVKDALSLMYGQVAGRKIDDNGIMQRGLIVRHLVLPGHYKESIEILDWIDENIPGTLLSLMSQYQPYYKASEYSEISKALDSAEYKNVVDHAHKLDFDGWIQDEPDESLAGVYFNPDKS